MEVRLLWEYKVELIDESKCNFEHVLNERGSERWEIVAHRICQYEWMREILFKRSRYESESQESGGAGCGCVCNSGQVRSHVSR